jgi:hypothetical protein
MHVMAVSPKPTSKRFSHFILLATRQARYFGLFENVTRLGSCTLEAQDIVNTVQRRVEWEPSIQYLINQLTAEGYFFRHKINRDGSDRLTRLIYAHPRLNCSL